MPAAAAPCGPPRGSRVAARATALADTGRAGCRSVTEACGHNRAMRAVPLAFTGSSAELRRHGRRDFLINLVLGGLYTSVARRHAADYLATHTTIDGTPLALVPVRKSRWPAILLVAAFLAARIANEIGHGPPLPLVIAAGVLLLPYLWGVVAMRSLGAIRWGELQVALGASWGEIYAASWPLLALGAAWVAAEPQVAAAVNAAGAPDPRWLLAAAAVAVFAFPLLPLQAFHLRRLRFTRTRIGGCEVAWSARFGPYLRLWCATAVAVLVTAVAPVLLLRYALLGSMTLDGLPPERALVIYAAAFVLMLLLAAPARAWYEARVFVLSWNGLRVGAQARVACALDVRAFVAMRSADALRTFCTFGLRRPEAVVKAYRA